MGYPDSQRGHQEELDADRYTRPQVLTTGVKQGWADPVDPRDVDFSQRPSFMGSLEFDGEGRPLNPYRTSDMPGDRGHLGKWGPNNAADPVVVANGKVLLIRRKDNAQWALPGDMVNPGEHVSTTAQREILKQANVDLGKMEGEVIYEGYVKDPRNTRNAWMETTARLFRIDYNPHPQADGEEVSDAQWFDCSDIDTLIASIHQFDAARGLPAQPLYASHSLIIDQALQKR